MNRELALRAIADLETTLAGLRALLKEERCDPTVSLLNADTKEQAMVSASTILSIFHGWTGPEPASGRFHIVSTDGWTVSDDKYKLKENDRGQLELVARDRSHVIDLKEMRRVDVDNR